MPNLAADIARQRETDAWRLRRDGYTHDEIAAQLGITRQGAAKILKRVTDRLAKDAGGFAAEYQAVSHARLSHIYREAMSAWERSKEPRKKSRSRETQVPGIAPQDLMDLPDGVPVDRDATQPQTLQKVVSKEASTSCGEVAYLNAALAADAEVRKLLGVNAPKKIDLLDKRRPLEKLSDEELERRLAEARAELAALEDGT